MWKYAGRWRGKISAPNDFSTAAAFERDVEVQQRDGGRHHRGSGENRRGDRNHRRNHGPVRSTSGFGGQKRAKVWAALAGVFLFVVLLALVDVMKTRRIKREIQWDKYYMRAVVQDYYHWQIGWRLEDLSRQAANQRDRMKGLLESLKEFPARGGGSSSPLAAKVAGWMGAGLGGAADDDENLTPEIFLAKVLAEEEDLNRVVSVECATRPNTYVQVGMHPMVASADASCKVYSAALTLDAHSLFEKIELGQGRFALRAFSNRGFLRVVPPQEGQEWYVWTLEVGAQEIGLPEVFQMRNGMVYNEIMHGYLSCSGAGAEAEVKGFVGDYPYQAEANYQLAFNPVSAEDMERARLLRDLSNAVDVAQRREAKDYVSRQAAVRKGVSRGEKYPQVVETIAICVPMTSRSTLMNSTYDSPVWTHAFETFLSTTDWRSRRFRYHWYLGFDVGDPIYDGPNAVENMEEAFFGGAKSAFKRLGFSPQDANAVIKHVLRLKPTYYSGLEHAPSYVVSSLIQDAYHDGCDYFYQINDDTLMVSPRWAETFTTILRENPLGRNVGVTGPEDTNNARILTHAFVHRTHIDIFGRYFPLSFRNWWSDDWISNVYGRDHTLRNHVVKVTHDVNYQKVDNVNRYTIDFTAQHLLLGELQQGHVKLSKWLRTQDLPPPALAMVCGFAPLADNILGIVEKDWISEHPPQADNGGGNGVDGGKGGGKTSRANRSGEPKSPRAGDDSVRDTMEDKDSPDHTPVKKRPRVPAPPPVS